jgi:hypothetical protein
MQNLAWILVQKKVINKEEFARVIKEGANMTGYSMYLENNYW